MQFRETRSGYPPPGFFACVPQPLFSKEYLYRMGHASGDLHDLLSFPELKKVNYPRLAFFGGALFRKKGERNFFLLPPQLEQCETAAEGERERGRPCPNTLSLCYCCPMSYVPCRKGSQKVIERASAIKPQLWSSSNASRVSQISYFDTFPPLKKISATLNNGTSHI